MGQGLGIHQFQLITFGNHHLGVGLWADTQPVNSLWCRQGTVGFHPYLETRSVEGINQRLVQLQQGFPTGANHVGSARGVGPKLTNMFGQLHSSPETTAILAVSTDKIGIAEVADSPRPILLPSGPQIAFAKPAEYRCPARLGTFTLQGVKRFLYPVHQARLS